MQSDSGEQYKHVVCVVVPVCVCGVPVRPVSLALQACKALRKKGTK